MLQRENVIRLRPDRTPITFIRELYTFSIKKKVHRTENKIIKSDMKDKKRKQKTDGCNIIINTLQFSISFKICVM